MAIRRSRSVESLSFMDNRNDVRPVTGPELAHYERLASEFDKNWSHSVEFVSWMSAAIVARLFPLPGRHGWAADIGCGTGLFSRALAKRAAGVLCADPSAAMLGQFPPIPSCVTLQASAEDLVLGRVKLPHHIFDAVLVKEAVHHMVDRRTVLVGLAQLLSSAGRLLVVMAPKRIDHPLFPDALDLFEQLQPDPEVVAEEMRAAGLAVELEYRSYRLSIPRSRYVRMVRSRYLSVLSRFDDEELEQGIEAMPNPGDSFDFVDRIAFVTGRCGV
ncbi:class I SAM-dependent methyltransferase [Nocardia sp. NPDC051832]|uniref:class I SAM-dependent methyltransferase n=1 Tax=Nocardia sp. NPDC051832 TaxID=3155673 RepID=UPI0034359C34